jgi:hypothetical protein
MCVHVCSCVYTHNTPCYIGVTAEACIESQASPCGFCGGQSGTDARFSPSTLVSAISIFPPMFHAHSFISH